MTHLVVQESVVLSECPILYNMTFLASNVVLLRFFKKMVYFNVKCHFVYTMKISMNEHYC